MKEKKIKIYLSLLSLLVLTNLIFILIKVYDSFCSFIQKDAVFLPLNYILILRNQFLHSILYPVVAGILAGVFFLIFSYQIRHKKLKAKKGFGLLETFISLTILTLVVIGMLAYLQYGMLLNVKTKEMSYAVRVTDFFLTKLDAIPYPYVFPCNSSNTEFGLTGTFGPVTNQTSPYPYKNILEELQTIIKNYGFSHFKLTTSFLIRDLSDLDGDGLTTDLRTFADNNSDLVDDYDPDIKYYDYNNDGDYYDIFGEPEETEEPNTHLKKLSIEIFKHGRIIYTTTKIISWEKFTGVESKASGAELKLVLTQPSENSILYALTTSEQIKSHNRTLTKEYPEEITAHRADSSAPLELVGLTDPLSEVKWYIESTNSPLLDSTIADNSGNFDFFAVNLTAELTEGENLIYGIAQKDSYSSPWSETNVILDIKPPVVENETPSGTVKTLQPLVEATILDEPENGNAETSGICSEVITLKYQATAIGTGTATHTFDSSTGKLRWIDSNTFLPVFSQGETVTIIVEAGDYAFYKTISTWTFTCNINTIDNSAPSIAETSPHGTITSNPTLISCKVFDNQSGINIQSIILELDGGVVVNFSNISEHYSPISNPQGGYINYLPDNALSSGEHQVTVKVSHWATEPNDKIEKIETWNFNVP